MRICDECKKELTEEVEDAMMIAIHKENKSKYYECCCDECAGKVILKMAQKVEKGAPVI